MGLGAIRTRTLIGYNPFYGSLRRVPSGPFLAAVSGEAPRLAECPACHAQLHACRQCRSWDADARKCRNPHVDEPPKDAERANFCDYFEMGDPGAPGKDARKALEDLLG